MDILKKRLPVRLVSIFILMVLFFSIFILPDALCVYAAASGAPGTPNLSSSSPVNGSYTITMNMWWGNNGTSWKLYENGTVILTQGLTDNSPNAQTASYAATNKPSGTYTYKCDLINSYGTTTSSPVTVTTGSAGTGSGINISSVDTAGEAVQMTISQGVSDYTLSANGVSNPSFQLATNNSSVIGCQLVNGTTLRLNGLKAGRASLRIKETTTNKIRYVGIRVKTSDGKLPGMPDYVGIGSVGTNVDRDLNFFRDFQDGDKNKRMDVRYIYLNGEPDAWDRNVDGWQKWGAGTKGDRAIAYIRESKKLGIIPFFVYYTICGGSESYENDLAHIQDAQYLGYYFKDLKFTLDTIANEAGDDAVGMIFEPDFLGYMMQKSGLQPDQITANTKLVYETAYGGANAVGILNSSTDKDPLTAQPFENTVQGLVRCVNYLVNKYNTTKGTNIHFGWQFNTWANTYPGTPSKGLMHKTEEVGITDGRAFISARAQETADYYIKAGILTSSAKLISIDKYGQDAVAFEASAATDPGNSTWFWNADNWNNYLIYVSQLHLKTNLPVILWQLPVGHIERSQAADPYHGGLFNQLTNTSSGASNYYEDSSTTFFFGDTFKPGAGNRWSWFTTNAGSDSLITNNGSDNVTWGSHFTAARDAGVSLALFGAGVGRATHGNVSDVSSDTVPEDDMWFFTAAQRYYANPVPLGGGTTTVATPTFSPAAGTYSSAQSVTISCATSGATIRYTTDGSTPTSSSPVYSSPVNVSSTTTIKAIASKSGMTDSAAASATYTISSTTQVTTPTFSPAAGTYSSAQSVTISCATSGATIRYTTNGSDPTSSSTAYTGPIAVSGTTTVKAKAFKSGMADSAIASATYTIGSTYPAWAPNTSYKVGDMVTYGGNTYKCITAHTSLVGWEPPNVPALWQAQ